MRFIRTRLELALQDPPLRSLLIWPTVLGAPRLREQFPEGVPESELFRQSRQMLNAFGIPDPSVIWRETLEHHPDTACEGPGGWLPGEVWGELSQDVSLRCGVILVALTGQPEDERYRLACAVTLFNMALFHECHDALEPLWLNATGPLKDGLQGLILMSAGFYHQQHHDTGGMMALWRDGMPMLKRFGGRFETPWGILDFGESLATSSKRLDWLSSEDDAADLGKLWEMPRPEWSLM
jgi:hypothetical protein